MASSNRAQRLCEVRWPRGVSLEQGVWGEQPVSIGAERLPTRGTGTDPFSQYGSGITREAGAAELAR